MTGQASITAAALGRKQGARVAATVKLLFVPVSGPHGAGEYYRSVAIAGAAQQRWPQAEISFVMNREAGYAQQVPFATRLIDGSPTYNTAAVKRAIEELRPDVVIFDSAGRRAQLACARRLRTRTVYISSRPTTRWKGFRLRRMRLLDQHWLVWPQFLQGEVTRWERLKLRLIPTVQIVPLNVIFPAPDPERAARLYGKLGVTRGRYVLISAGGGGNHRGGRPASEVFAEAAARIRSDAQLPEDLQMVWVRGPNYAGEDRELPGVQITGALGGEQMIDLLAGARLGVINGGSLLLQALSLQVPCVAAPVATDQDRRIELCARRGLLASAPLDAAAIATATCGLLRDTTQYSALLQELQRVNLANGVEVALDALARLMNRP